MSFSNLKERIKTVKNTSKITKAMSLISAAQTNKIKYTLQSYENYYKLINEITGIIAFKGRYRFDENNDQIIIEDKFIIESCQKYLDLDTIYSPGTRKLLVVMTSDKGLCGGFNSSITTRALSMIDDNTDVLCIGKKGYEILNRNRQKKINFIKNNYIELQSRHINGGIIMGKITMHILRLLASNLYYQVEILYTEFITMLKQEVTTIKLLPLIIDHPKSDEIKFDSNPMNMLDSIIPRYINATIYYIVLHSIKSETAKRMISMDNANKNSQEMLKSLTLRYNRTRQTKVTMELIEVISGTLDL